MTETIRLIREEFEKLIAWRVVLLNQAAVDLHERAAREIIQDFDRAAAAALKRWNVQRAYWKVTSES